MSRTAELSGTGVVGKKRRPGFRLFLLLVLFPAVLIVVYTWAALHYAYASGERAGYIQKISRKGWLCKTWEGELAMTTVPGTAPQIFQFSVRDEAIAHKIADSAGQRVALSYEQHKGIPGSCFGESEYFITGVRPISP